MENSYNKIQQRDPIGQAILDYANNYNYDDIIVNFETLGTSNQPIKQFFRSKNELCELELHALKLCRGDVLDVGAGAGPHCTILQNNGINVFAIEASAGATKHLKNINIPAENILFKNFKPNKKFDTILMLWNGIGIAGTLEQLKPTLLHAKSLLNPGGQILCDSTDSRYIYESNALILNLNEEYYGNFRFRCSYKKTVGDWVNWLFIDYDRLQSIAHEIGYSCKQISEQDHCFLAQLIIN